LQLKRFLSMTWEGCHFYDPIADSLTVCTMI